VLGGGSGGHCDVGAGGNHTIFVAPLLAIRNPSLQNRVTTRHKPGQTNDLLVTHPRIAVNAAPPDIRERLLVSIIHK
ncbi:citrate lyase subunit alpha, partial [Enterobacter mori]